MSSDNELKKISKIYNSDKIEHDYIDLYHSYEDMKYYVKSKRTGNKIRYYLKYKIIYKFYTYLLFILNLIKKILLLRF